MCSSDLQALDELAETADREVHADGFYASYLLRHHIHDGRFAWPDGRSGRAAASFGYDPPTTPPETHEQFLGELCHLVTLDVCSPVSTHPPEIDRRDAGTLARRYGIGVERVHNALDRMRYPHLYQVGIPHWHEITDTMRSNLAGLDGVWVEAADFVRARRRTEPDRPTHVNNVGAATDPDARAIVARIVELDPDILGARVHPRILPPEAS